MHETLMNQVPKKFDYNSITFALYNTYVATATITTYYRLH